MKALVELSESILMPEKLVQTKLIKDVNNTPKKLLQVAIAVCVLIVVL
jgi:hypothetical protein